MLQSSTCGNCKYFVPQENRKEMGSCRRFPPQRGHQAHEFKPKIVGAPPEILLIPDCDFALTQATNWCGEFDRSEIAAVQGTA